MHFFKTHRPYNIKDKPECKLWPLVNNHVSISIHQLYQTYHIMQGVSNRKLYEGPWPLSVLSVQVCQLQNSLKGTLFNECETCEANPSFHYCTRRETETFFMRLREWGGKPGQPPFIHLELIHVSPVWTACGFAFVVVAAAAFKCQYLVIQRKPSESRDS